MGASSSSDKKPPPKSEAAPLFTLAHLVEGARGGTTLKTHENAAWSCGATFHDDLNELGERTRLARLSPHALCTAWEQQAREHLEHGPPMRTCFCDTTLCTAARGSASLVINDQAFPGIYLTGETIGLMALEPLQALVSKAKSIIKKDEKLSAGVMLTPLTTGSEARDVLSGQAINDVFKKQTGGTVARRELYGLHYNKGELQFADFILDIVMRGSRAGVVVELQDGSEYDFGEPDALLDLKPDQIAVVMIENGGASNKGICRVLASVQDPENPEEYCPVSCLSYDFRT